jgi:hypothetical protein
MNLRLTDRIEELRDGLIHPVRQQLRVFAYEVLWQHTGATGGATSTHS